MKKHQRYLCSILLLLWSCSTSNLPQSKPQKVNTPDVTIEELVPEAAPDSAASFKLQDTQAPAPESPGPKWYWQYKDLDGDGFGNGLNPDSVFFKKAKVGYAAKKGDCNDANNKINPAAPDGCGTDMNCNGIGSEGQVNKLWWHDGDGDGYGDATDEISSCDPMVPGYVLNSADCNDANPQVYAGAVEVLNGKDDDCDGSADEGLVTAGITINVSTVLIPEYMSAGGTNEMFANNDPDDAAWLAKLAPGNFGSWVHAEGHNSQWFRWKVPYGSQGNGFNSVKPKDVTEAEYCGIMNGDLCKSYSRDFNLSWLKLVDNLAGKPLYTCNISRGTLAELYYVIETRPDLKVIMYGQENATGTIPAFASAKEYAPKFYEWVDSVKAKFPGRELYHLADIPDIGGKKLQWTSDFINYKKLPSWICVRQYSHGFTKYTLTGKINNDTAGYTYAIKTTLPKQVKNVDSTFMGGGVFLSQFSTGVPAYAVGTNGNNVALQGRCVDVMYYMRAEKVFIEAHRDGLWNLLGANIIGLKNLMTSLDFKWLGILNNLYTVPRYATSVSHTMGPQVDVMAGYANSTYGVVVQNRSGMAVVLPEYYNLDGDQVKVVYNKTAGYSCASLTATAGVDFNVAAAATLDPYCIVYLEFKK